MRGTKMDEGRYSLMDRFQRLGGILNWKEVAGGSHREQVV